MTGTPSQGGHGGGYGIDLEKITLVADRPDEYVGMVIPSSAISDHS